MASFRYYKGIKVYDNPQGNTPPCKCPYLRVFFADNKFSDKNVGDRFEFAAMELTGGTDGQNLQEIMREFNNGEGERAYVIDRTNNILGVIRDTENPTYFNIFIIATPQIQNISNKFNYTDTQINGSSIYAFKTGNLIKLKMRVAYANNLTAPYPLVLCKDDSFNWANQKIIIENYSDNGERYDVPLGKHENYGDNAIC